MPDRGRMAGMKPVEPQSPEVKPPLKVSIAAFYECDPSIIYGIYDTLWTAGSLWRSKSNEPICEVLFKPRIVAAEPGPLTLITGVTIVPQYSVDDAEQPDIVIVPNVILD